MELVSVDLLNVGVHQQKSIKFGGGLIGIFGPMGSGKTTIPNAIYAAITNDFSRLADGKAEAVCQQSTGDKSHIDVTLNCNCGQISLFRGLAPTTSNRMRLPDGKELTKETEIRSAIAGILGANRALLDNYVFVDQWSIRGLFQATPSQRSEALSHLCGTKFLEGCYSAVSKLRDKDTQLLSVGIEDTDRLRRELGSYNDLLERESGNLAHMKQSFRSSKEIANNQYLIDEYEEKKRLLESLPSLVHRRRQATEELTELSVKLGVLRCDFEKLTRSAEELRLKREVIDREVSMHKLELRQWQFVERLDTRLEAIAKSLEAIPEHAPMWSHGDLPQQLRATRAAMAPHQAIVEQFKNLPDADHCPACGQSIENFQESLTKAREELTRLEKTEAATSNAIKEIDDKVEEQGRLFHQRESLLHERARLTNELIAAGVVKKPIEPAIPLKEIEAEYNKAASAVTQAKGWLDTLTRDVSQAEAKLQALDKEHIDVQVKASEIEVTQSDYMAAKNLIDANRQIELNLAASGARIEEYKRVILERTSLISVAERKAAEMQKTRDWVDLLARVAPKLHHDGLPMEVHSRAIRRLEGSVNKTLEEFESPFRVTAGDGLSYTAHFSNNTRVPAHRLSGGQQVVLSLAFRWALNSLFASQIGLLVLDEPTAGLDERHLGLLESTLSRLGSAARNRGCQVVIITHERRLQGVFDQVIELDRSVL